MHFSSSTLALGIASLAASVCASSLQVNNYCAETLWVTLVNSTYGTSQVELPSGQAFVETIVGQGNSLGLTKSADYYNSQTAKLILGTSINAGDLYWSVSNVDGDPFAGEGFNVTSTPDVCGSTTTYDGTTHACPDGSFTLSLNPCYNE